MNNNNEYVQAILNDYNSAEIDDHISETETMNDPWYFNMGKYAIDAIVHAVAASKIKEYGEGEGVTKVLDLPCGHGRVMRHLVKLFKGAEIHACDLDKDGVDFCAERYGAVPIYSVEELEEMDFGCQYDLIWVGSLFTHTSREVTKRWMAHLARFLSPQGIVVATVHGRWSEYVHDVAPYINDDTWEEILEEYRATGYGYRDYEQKESHSFISGSYGISIVKPHVTISDIEEIPNSRIFQYMERGWGDHQDVVVYGRPSHAKLWPDT